MTRAIEFVQTHVFTKQAKLLFSDDELRVLESDLIRNPELGDLIQGTGGLRKVRVATGHGGKSGGSRVIYLLAHTEKVYFILAYGKNKKDTLTDAEKAVLKKLAQRLKEEL